MIYTNASSQPPTRLEPTCQMLSYTGMQLPIEAHRLPVRNNGRHMYRRFDYEKRLNISGASLDLSNWYNGSKFGDLKFKIASD